MKTLLIKFVFVGIVAIVSGINVYNSQKPKVLSDVAMANVEALAQDETGKGNCSRAITLGNCYNISDGMWACLRIKEVVKYDVTPGSIIECKHDKVTECPYGTEEK